jgi:hypothetical protein
MIKCEATIEFVVGSEPGEEGDRKGGFPIRITLKGVPDGLHMLIANAFLRGVQASGHGNEGQPDYGMCRITSKGMIVVDTDPTAVFPSDLERIRVLESQVKSLQLKAKRGVQKREKWNE